MKRIVKWSLIVGTVICLLGVGMITAGAMMGGGEAVVSYFGGYHGVGYWQEVWDEGPDEDGRFVSGQTDHQFDEAVSYEGISKLAIESAIGTVELVEERREDPNDRTVRVARFHTRGNSRNYYEIRQDEEELEIYFVGHSKRIRREEVESLIIYVPEGYRFRKVNLETNAGRFYAKTLYADEAELVLRAGEILIDSGEIADLDVECAAGRLECKALAGRSANVECQAGSVDIWLAEQKDRYNYELECKTGTITLMGEEKKRYTGLWQKKYIDYRAANQVELECAAGEITVNFPDSV